MLSTYQFNGSASRCAHVILPKAHYDLLLITKLEVERKHTLFMDMRNDIHGMAVYFIIVLFTGNELLVCVITNCYVMA